MATAGNPLEGIQQDKDGNFYDTVDLGDGSGPQVFKGKTVAELLAKYRQAQTHATRKIREQALALKLRDTPDPAPPPVNFNPHTPTPDELWTLSNDLKDPAKAATALKRAIEWELGTSIGEIRESIRRQRMEMDRQQIFAAGEAFLEAHPEFKRCTENEQAIFGYLEKHNLAYTRKNFEIAYGELRDGLILVAPTSQAQALNTGTPSAPRIEPSATRPRTAQTGLSSRASSAVPPTTPTARTGRLTEAEIDAMPTEEYLRRVSSDPTWAAEAEKVLADAAKARARR